MQSTTTLITEIGVTAGVAGSFYKETPDNRRKMARGLITGGLITSSTIVAGEGMNQKKIDQIYEKYSSSYMASRTDEELQASMRKLEFLDSLSDEELSSYLEQANLLAKSEEDTSVKTI